MFHAVTGGFHTSGYLLLTFKWKTSGEWFLATYAAFLVRGRTLAAGDNVHLFAYRNSIPIVFIFFTFC
jgi:hypothetical protein